jgi:hypothetical protein
MSTHPHILREQHEAAALRLKVRGVARRLGADIIETSELQPWLTIVIAPTVHLRARRSWRNPKMILWLTHCPQGSASEPPSICAAVTRPCSALTADVQRRLVPAARAWCRKAVEAAARAQDRAQAQRAKRAELEQVLGPMRDGHDDSYAADGFTIRRDEVVTAGYGRGYRANIQVHSWHCLLMIAKLVAEDQRIAKAEAPPPAPEA